MYVCIRLKRACENDDRRFEVIFIGSEASIDGQNSEAWIRDQTAAWPFPSSVQVSQSLTRACSTDASERHMGAIDVIELHASAV